MTKIHHDLVCTLVAAAIGVLLVIIGIATGAPAAVLSHVPTL